MDFSEIKEQVLYITFEAMEEPEEEEESPVQFLSSPAMTKSPPGDV